MEDWHRDKLERTGYNAEENYWRGRERLAKKLVLEEANNLLQSPTDSESDDSLDRLDIDGAMPSGMTQTRPYASSEPHKYSPLGCRTV